MVTTLAGYPWSSYLVHGLGKTDPLLSRLPVWDKLGKDIVQRQASWRDWVHTPLTERELAAVRQSLVSGKPFGNSAWTEQMIRSLGLRFEARQRGRPRKLEKMN